MRKKVSEEVKQDEVQQEETKVPSIDWSKYGSRWWFFIIVALIIYLLLSMASRVNIHSIKDEVSVDDYGYTTIRGYHKVKADGVRVFQSDEGVVLPPMSSSVAVIAMKRNFLGTDVAYGIVGGDSVSPSPSPVVTDSFVDDVVKIAESNISSQYRSYFKDIAKVYRDVQSKHLSSESEILEALSRGVRGVLGFDDPEVDSAMESEYQSFFGASGAFPNYIESHVDSPYNWDELLIKCASAFERVK